LEELAVLLENHKQEETEKQMKRNDSDIDVIGDRDTNDDVVDEVLVDDQDFAIS
jgi:hypothetical protein